MSTPGAPPVWRRRLRRLLSSRAFATLIIPLVFAIITLPSVKDIAAQRSAPLPVGSWDSANLLTWNDFFARGLQPMKDFWYPYGNLHRVLRRPCRSFSRVGRDGFGLGSHCVSTVASLVPEHRRDRWDDRRCGGGAVVWERLSVHLPRSHRRVVRRHAAAGGLRTMAGTRRRGALTVACARPRRVHDRWGERRRGHG